MDNQVFRKKSLEQISSPEQLNDYLHVTNPTVWLVLAAIIVLLAGMLIWSSRASIDSFAAGNAQVQDGAMRITFDDPQLAKNIKTGMTVEVGNTATTVSSIGYSDDGSLFAMAETSLTDGVYPVRVIFKNTQVINLLFN